MAFTYGFYNSIKGDRRYDTRQISAIFDGIITDGVFSSVGGIFATVPGEGMTVVVKSGRAWFDHTWSYNDGAMPLSIDAADVTMKRYDAVVLEVNNSEEVRENAIKVVKGTPATNPVKPGMTNTETINQHPLAYVLVDPGVTSITADKIDIRVGKSDCPFSTAILQTVSIDDLFNTWESEFDQWFSNVQAQLEGNIVTNLQKQIDDRVKIADKATSEDIASATPNKWVDAAGLKESVEPMSFSIGDMVDSMRTGKGDNWLLCNGDPILESNYPKLAPFLSRFNDAVVSQSSKDFRYQATFSNNLAYATKDALYLNIADTYNTYYQSAYDIRITDPNHKTELFHHSNLNEAPYLCNSYNASSIATNGDVVIVAYDVYQQNGKQYIPKICVDVYAINDYSSSASFKTYTLYSGASGSSSIGLYVYKIDYLNGYFVVLSNKGNYYSVDGINWSSCLSGLFDVADILYDGNRYVFVTRSGTVGYMTNLTSSPTTNSNVASAVVYHIRYVNGYYVLTTYNGLLYSSSHTFTSYSSNTTGNKNSNIKIFDIAYFNNSYWISGAYNYTGTGSASGLPYIAKITSLESDITVSKNIDVKKDYYWVYVQLCQTDNTLYGIMLDFDDYGVYVFIIDSRYAKLPTVKPTNGNTFIRAM